MSDAQQPPTAPGQVSPDGHYVWNGTAWVPNPSGPGAGGVPPVPANPKAAAKAAKAYAKASRPWYKKKRWIGAIVIVAIIAIASATGSGGSSDDSDSPAAASDNSKSDDTKKSDDNKKPAAKPVITTAAAMIKAYQDNELGADQKYKGKIVQVTGVVDKIDTEPFDDSDYIVDLGGGSDFEILTVRAWDLPNKIISTISKGDTITVRCKFDDGGDLGVDIKHCDFIK